MLLCDLYYFLHFGLQLKISYTVFVLPTLVTKSLDAIRRFRILCLQVPSLFQTFVLSEKHTMQGRGNLL